MSESEPTWIMLVRDLSSTVVIDDEPQVIAGLILDADTGLIRAVSMGATAQEACAAAATTALTQAVGPLPPHPPVRVVLTGSWADDMAEALDEALPDAQDVELITSPPLPEAEDILDSLVGHLTGRTQPMDPPTPDDWSCLYARAADYERARPWQLWSDADPLHLAVTVNEETAQYVAVVIGQAGIQRGLALYPGDTVPEPSLDLEADDAELPVAEGTLVMWLDPPAETPTDLAERAARYGWPEDAEFLPMPLALGTQGLGDLDQQGAWHLTVAMAAVLAHQRPRVVQADGRRTSATQGTLALADDVVGTFTIG